LNIFVLSAPKGTFGLERLDVVERGRQPNFLRSAGIFIVPSRDTMEEKGTGEWEEGVGGFWWYCTAVFCVFFGLWGRPNGWVKHRGVLCVVWSRWWGLGILDFWR